MLSHFVGANFGFKVRIMFAFILLLCSQHHCPLTMFSQRSSIVNYDIAWLKNADLDHLYYHYIETVGLNSKLLPQSMCTAHYFGSVAV